DTVFDAPPITVPVADLRGWLVTLLTGSPTMLSQGNLLIPLIDNSIAWEELTKTIKAAQVSINSAQLYLDVGKVFTVFVPTNPEASPPLVTHGERFEDEIIKANFARGIPVRLIMNDFMGEPYPIDSAGVVEDYIKHGTVLTPNTVEIRRFRMPYNRAMHAKFTIIDGEIAIMNASPILQEYFDDTTHFVDDPRRGSMSFPKNSIKIPVHDVSCSIQGPALEHLEEIFALLWWKTGGTEVGVTSPIPPTATNTSVQIVRTLPGGTFFSSPFDVPKGELGILEAYQRAIAEAKDYIYLENQYFTEPLIARALLAALRDGSRPELRVIILVNNVVDIPGYQGLQTRLIGQLLNDAEKHGVRDRLGVFTRWTHDAKSSPQRIIRNYIHSKVGIVDNKWATIGSANLDGVSLHVSQHIAFFYSTSDMLEERAVELNTVLYNGVDGQPFTTVPDELRRDLWAEHLGVDRDDSLIKASTMGSNNGANWLNLWNTKAEEKAKGLSKSPLTHEQASILKWLAIKDPEKYLAILGVKESKDLKIETEIRDFDFKTGKWA
ncbi:phospholipase D-like domain-containing protein, partial [Nitrospira sp. BLG_2]|uniref:phospholipase D-like domain-containing protein n=1 Tax=Nitrospira sp. BLG_2 TaxID=3397507 RepID=UPI003B991B3C